METKTLELNQVLSLLKEYSESLPRRINPPEEEKLLLLVEPVNFKELILQSPGVSIFKALYGRGKTYGIGYYTVHYCETTGERECSAIYINLRRAHRLVQDRIRSAQKSTDPHGDLLQMIINTANVPDQMTLELVYIILSILDPRTRNDFGTNVTGDFLVTSKISKLDHKIIDDIKVEVLKSSDKLSRLFEVLTEKLILQLNISPKLILILDEFEQLVGANIENKQIVGNLLQNLLESLRSDRGGVLERYPYRFVLVLTVQQVVYPSDIMRSIKTSGKPVVGKIAAISDDLSIPIRFSPCTSDCIKEYYEKALNLLAKKGLISETERKSLQSISQCMTYYLDDLVKMPARLFFDRLREVIARLITEYRSQILQVVGTNSDKSHKNVCDELKGIFDDLRGLVSSGLYSIYTEREVTGLGKEKILSMLEELANSLEADKPGDKQISLVKANGYEGVVVTFHSDRYVDIFIYKGRSTKLREGSSRQNINSLKQGFIKHYGDKLVEYCSPPSRSKKDNECKVFIVHPKEADVTAFFDAIYSISQINNVSISKRVFDVPLDRDELAALYVKSPTPDATTAIGGVIGGDITYYEQRFKELIDEIKSKVGMLSTTQGAKK